MAKRLAENATWGLLLSGLLLQGCTSLHPFESTEPHIVAARVRSGDQLQIVGKDGQRRNLRVTTIAGELLQGETARGRTVTIAFTDIEEIHSRELQRGKTTALIVGGVLLGLFALDHDDAECFNPFVIEGC